MLKSLTVKRHPVHPQPSLPPTFLLYLNDIKRKNRDRIVKMKGGHGKNEDERDGVTNVNSNYIYRSCYYKYHYHGHNKNSNCSNDPYSPYLEDFCAVI